MMGCFVNILFSVAFLAVKLNGATQGQAKSVTSRSETIAEEPENEWNVPFKQPKVHISTDQLASQAIFRKIAILPSQTAQARLIFTYRLWEIDHYLLTFTEQSEMAMLQTDNLYKNHSIHSSIKPVHAEVRARLSVLEEKWASYRTVFFRTSDDKIELDKNGYINAHSNFSATRKKRAFFIPFLMVALASGISLWTTSQTRNLAENGGPSKEGTKFIVKQLADLKLNHDLLRKQFVILHRDYGERIGNIEHMHQLANYRESFFSPLRKIEKKLIGVMRGLDMCNMHALSPEIVSAKAVASATQLLEKQAKTHSFFLPHESIGYIYQQRIEYFTEWNGVLNIVVKLFLVETSSLLDLYEYVNLPLLVKGLKYGIEPRTEHQLMAISDARDRVLLLDKDQLQDCTVTSGLTLCPNLDFYYKKPKDYCLSSLFMADYTAAQRTCNFQLVPQIDKLVQTSPTTFILFNSIPKMLTIKCPDKVLFMETYVGSKSWRVQPMCTAFTDSVQFKAAPILDVSFDVSEAANAFKMEDVFGNLTISQINSVLPKELTEELPLVDIIKQYNEIEELHNARTFSPKAFSLSLGTTIFLFFIMFIMLFCARNKIKQCFMGVSDKAHARRLTEHGFSSCQPKKVKKVKKRSRVIWTKSNKQRPVEIEMSDAKTFRSAPPDLQEEDYETMLPQQRQWMYGHDEPNHGAFQPNVQSPKLPAHHAKVFQAHQVQEFLDRESRNRPTNVLPI